MAERIGSIEQFLEDVVCGVQRKGWMPKEGSEVDGATDQREEARDERLCWLGRYGE